MTPQQAFDGVIIQQVGSYCLMIANQAAAAADLQNKLAEAEKKIAEQAKEIEALKAINECNKPTD